MSRLMMGFQVIFLLMFFAGIEVSAISEKEVKAVNRCMEMLNFVDDIEDFMKLDDTEQLTLLCTNATGYFICINDVLKEGTGFTAREMANFMFMKGTENDLSDLVELEVYVHEICRNRPKTLKEFTMDFLCFARGHMKVVRVKKCRTRSVTDYIFFSELHSQRWLSEADSRCIITAYHLGCVGATVYEECGFESFNRYKTSIKEMGFFKNGLCSSDLKQILKATFLKSFDMSVSRKRIYSSIIELKRRRK